MKKIFSLVLVSLLLLMSFAAFAEDGEVLVLYASRTEPYLTNTVNQFTEATGIEVEVVSAGTAELQKRIEAEGDEPLGDVMLGGMMYGSYLPMDEYWMDYDSPLNDTLPADAQCIAGSIYGFSYVGSCLMINNAMLEELGIEVNGYQDLLQPELKGKIVMPDPTQTSSGWEQLVNILYAMGDGDPDAGWDFVRQLMENGMVLTSGSSASHKAVADGEYAVGLVCEAMVTTYIEEGMDIGLVWMEEGVIMNCDGIAAIKNCKHPESAKAFVDFLISEEYQNLLLAETPQVRPVLSDLDTELKLTPIDEINVISCDYDYISTNKDAILEQMKDIMTDYL